MVAYATLYPGIPEPFISLFATLIGIVVMNWLEHIIFVFIVRYLIIFHNLMQLTNIDDQVVVRQSSIAFWSISVFVVIIDINIATKVEDTAPYLVIQNGYFVVGDRSNYFALAGFGIFTLGLLTVIVFCIVQIRIELGRIHFYNIFCVMQFHKELAF